MTTELANNTLRVSSLNFNGIKNDLIEYFRSKPEFYDYDYEGSVISHLLDVLAYNTYKTAFYNNMRANEQYLDTTTIRENASSISKHFDYLPRSARSAKATITVYVNPTDNPGKIIIPKYTRFTSTLDNTVYEFVTAQDYIIDYQNGESSKDIDIYEGYMVTQNFTYDSDQTWYELFNENIDSTSIVVEVKESVEATDRENYTQFTDLVNTTQTSKIFYLEETGQGTHRIRFGDGVLGQSLTDGNRITVTYRICSGANPNDIALFEAVTYIAYNASNEASLYETTGILTINKADAGQDIESLESIQFNAPRKYERQKRLVTGADYESFILEEYSDIQSIAVWGGEENDPPIYGKTIISAKPYNKYVLPTARKEAIKTEIEKWNVRSIDPIFVDPTFVYIIPTILVYYNSSRTVLSADAIHDKIATSIQNYDTNNLGIFGGKFQYSRFMRKIDDSDASIDSNSVDLQLQKRFVPVINSNLTYNLQFENPIYHPYDGYLGAITSTAFKIATNSNWLYLDDDGRGKLRVYQNPNNKTYVNRNAGTVDYSSGKVTLNNFVFSDYAGDEVKINVEYDNIDIEPVKNQILLLTNVSVQMFDTSKNKLIRTEPVSVFGDTSPFRTNEILGIVPV